MTKLEVFDPAMCCSTGICGTNVEPKLVIFASDLEWLKKQGVDVVRYGLSFEPAEFVKNEAVKNILCECGNACLPLILVDNEIVSRGVYPSRKHLAEFCKIDFNEQDAPPVHREENCCCGEDCDCSHVTLKETLGCSINKNSPAKKSCGCGEECDCSNAPAEDNCCCVLPEEKSICGPECDCHKSVASDKLKKIIFVIVLLIIAGIIAIKLSNKAGAAEIKNNTQAISVEKIGESLDSLNQIHPSQEVVLIYIPAKSGGKISGKTKAAMLSAQSILKDKKIIATLYTINPKSLDYPQIASKTTPPAVLTIYNGKGKNYVSGTINTTRLLQSYIAAKQDGACGAGCPCHKK